MESKSSSSGITRRAAFKDREAVVSIGERLFDGLDYMPALFFVFLQSKRQIVYVYEEDGKLIGLASYYFPPDSGGMAYGSSGRVQPSYLGKGFGRLETSPLTSLFRDEYPKVRTVTGAVLLTPSIEAKLKDQWDSVYLWNIQLYMIPDRRSVIPILIRSLREVANSIQPVRLPYTEANEWLNRNNDLVDYLSRYSTQFVIAGRPWKPIPINKGGLRYIFSISNSVISFAEKPTADKAKPLRSALDPTRLVERQTEGGRLPKPFEDAESNAARVTKNEISGLSYSCCVPCEYGLCVDLVFFGDDEEVLVRHVYEHLRHYFDVTEKNVRIGYYVNFPTRINSENVEGRLKPVLGERFCNGHMSNAKQAVIYSTPWLPSKI